ncbi:MAG TPA: PPA1309 family protein [Propionicimonas sp.]|jgi:hypothetical protein|nr:PPA1309 family protein [Propionicimonas sp.]
MSEALIAALIEVERHVAKLGWDQPARLFALVRTKELIEAEPHLAEALGAARPDGFSSVEQDEFSAGADLAQTLSEIMWPPAVAGCVLCVERAFLPPDAEADLPEDPDRAADVVAEHPRRLDVRLVVGVTRDGQRHGVARVRDAGAELLTGTDLVPALTEALAHTFE